MLGLMILMVTLVGGFILMVNFDGDFWQFILGFMVGFHEMVPECGQGWSLSSLTEW